MEPAEIGAFALCAAMLATLTWVIKELTGIIKNDLKHVEEKLDSLPCRPGESCPEEKDE